ncbi:MAG: hypothetical protein LBR50_06390 [Tannerella sp.]|jgi:hypothetical protein|nr:hypothetical protein [Tannerella sp.]
METYKDLAERYNELNKEAGKYNRPEFDEVYTIIADLIRDRNYVGDRGNLAYPLVTGDVIDEALKRAGFADDEAFVSDFLKYREIEQQAREIQRQSLSLPDHPANILIASTPQEQAHDGWRFATPRIICPDFMSDIIDETLLSDLKEGKGLYSNVTEIPVEDEADDDFLMVEAYGLKCSLQPYYRELQQYGIIGSKIVSDDLKPVFLGILNKLVIFIKDNTTAPNKVRNKIRDTIKSLDEVVGLGLIWQILLLQGLCRWFEGININESDDGYNEACDLYTWIMLRLMEKELWFCYYKWGEKDKEDLQPLCRYLYSTEIGKIVQERLFSNEQSAEPQQAETATKPKCLTIPDNILQALQQAGFIENAAARPLKWIKTNSTTHGLITNKRSLLDLLCLLGYPDSIIKDKKLLKSTFGIEFKANNYTDLTDSRGNLKRPIISEYHNELETIIRQTGQEI